MATSPSKPGPKPVPNAAPPEESGEEPIVPKKSKKKRIVMIIVTLLMLGGGAIAWYFMGQDSNKPKTAETKVESGKPPVFVQLEQFTVNLQAETGEQFLQVAMTLQVADEAQVELFKLYMPQVRSRMLLLLSSKKASEISSLEGKKKLSEDIIAQLKQPFTPDGPPQNVNNVFFTSFVIQ